jgi:hypothetical protein
MRTSRSVEPVLGVPCNVVAARSTRRRRAATRLDACRERAREGRRKKARAERRGPGVHGRRRKARRRLILFKPLRPSSRSCSR